MKKKLFITPRPGYLAKTIAELRKESYDVSVVGWGYPPVYVESDKNQHKMIEELTREVDAEAKFALYRADSVEASELINILKQFTIAKFKELCLEVKFNYGNLPGSAGDDLDRLAVELVTKFQEQNDLPALVEAAYKINPRPF